MTIIVTGGAGFNGANFIFHMLDAHSDYKIVCADKLTYAGNLSTLESLMVENTEGYNSEKATRFRFVKLDICNRDRV